jgi:hypothetical protein
MAQSSEVTDSTGNGLPEVVKTAKVAVMAEAAGTIPIEPKKKRKLNENERNTVCYRSRCVSYRLILRGFQLC